VVKRGTNPTKYMIIKNKYLYEQHKNVPPDYYEDCKTNILQKLWHQKKLQGITKYLKKIGRTEKVLDIGCHSGDLSQRIGELLGANVTAIDISESAINYARKKYPQINFDVADITEYKTLPKDKFDLVTAFDVLEHIPHTHKVAKNISSTLRKGGYLIVGVPSNRLLFKIIWSIWTKFMKGKVWRGTHYKGFCLENLNKELSENGVTLIEEGKANFNLWNINTYKHHE